MHTWLHDDAAWAGKDAPAASAAVAAGLFPDDDDDWFPGAAMPVYPACATGWDEGRPVSGSWSHDHGHCLVSGGSREREPTDGSWGGVDPIARHWSGATACAGPEDDGAGAWYTSYGADSSSRLRAACEEARAGQAAAWCGAGGGGGDYLPWGTGDRMH